jgi:phage tail-like protein
MTIDRTTEGTGAYWFEVSIDPPAGHLPSWKSTTWFVVRSISGLNKVMDTIDIYEGGASGKYRTLPGKKHWPTLVLQGVVAQNDKSFFDWFESVTIGSIARARAHGTIRLKNGNGATPVATWTFDGAFPIKYSGPTLDTHSALLAFETIELTHQGLKRET